MQTAAHDATTGRKIQTMPASLIGAMRAMAYNNAWANHRLAAACAKLSQAEFEASRTGFFPSLKATLNHILIIDWFYVDALEGGSLGPAAWSNQLPCATLAELSAEQARVDRRLIAFCAALSEEALSADSRVQRRDHVQIERTDRLLMHLFQHQV